MASHTHATQWFFWLFLLGIRARKGATHKLLNLIWCIAQWAELYLGANQKFGGLRSPKPLPGYVPAWLHWRWLYHTCNCVWFTWQLLLSYHCFCRANMWEEKNVISFSYFYIKRTYQHGVWVFVSGWNLNQNIFTLWSADIVQRDASLSSFQALCWRSVSLVSNL